MRVAVDTANAITSKPSLGFVIGLEKEPFERIDCGGNRGEFKIRSSLTPLSMVFKIIIELTTRRYGINALSA